MRLLVIEDEMDTRQLLCDLLSRGCSGLRIVEAGTLAEARLRLTAEAVDIIVTDLNLPDGSSVSLLPLIKVPAALLTGSPNKPAGFDVCFTKPINLPSLFDWINAKRKAT